MNFRHHPACLFIVAALTGTLTGCSDDGGPATGDPSASSSDDGSAETSGDSTGAESTTDDPTTATADTSGESSSSDPTDATQGSSSETGVSRCGDGVAEGDEACDGTDLLGEDCVSFGFDSGRLTCSEGCTFDTSGCNLPCGNGVLEDGEECDSTEFGDETCVTQGFADGELSCTKDCTIETDACITQVCGNGAVEGDEACDGVELAGTTCASLGYDGGDLACNDACELDTTACVGTPNCCQPQDGLTGCANDTCEAAVCAIDDYCCNTEWDGICVEEAYDLCPDVCPPTCGDGMVTGAEECDGGDLQEQSCGGLGLPAGNLACDATCHYDTTLCTGEPGTCCTENAVAGCADDECEAAICAFDAFCCENTWDQQCANEASVQAECFDLPSCPPTPVCGDGIIGGNEVCDGAALGNQTCVTQGASSSCCFAGVETGCDDAECEATICSYDAYCCETEWDDLCADEAAADCAELCTSGELACAADCLDFDVSGC